MSAPKDDLEAVRAVVDAIKDFKSDEQQRIFRWVAEKLGLPHPFATAVHTPPTTAPPHTGSGATPPLAQPLQVPPTGAIDIKTFIAAKKPRKRPVRCHRCVLLPIRSAAGGAKRCDRQGRSAGSHAHGWQEPIFKPAINIEQRSQAGAAGQGV